MKSLLFIPFFKKIIIFISITFLGIIIIIYNLQNRFEKIDNTVFNIYEKEYNDKKIEIKQLNKKLIILKNLEKKFDYKYVNKNDIQLFIENILNTFKKLNLIGNYKIIDVQYDKKYINLIKIKIKFYNKIDKDIAKDLFNYMFNNIIDKNLIKLDKIFYDKKNDNLILMLYR